jgi:hypothetical protein
MFKCEICGKEFVKLHGLSIHISKTHKIKSEEYYLKYINSEKGKCKTCGKNTRFNNLIHGYSIFCSTKCSNNSIEVQNKKKETYFEKTGYRNPSQNPEIKEKKKETCLENSGCEYSMQNSEIREKRKQTYFEKTGYENPMQNPESRKKQKESKLRNNNGIHPRKLTYKHVQERYPDVIKIEGLIEGPNGEIWGHCKNTNCKNSKENGGYFEVTPHQINMRNRGINTHDTSYFYCCEECKHSCPLYGRTATELHNLINENPETLHTQAELSTWREEVFLRQKIEYDIDYNFCEHCQSKENLHAHHIQPIKLYPGYALDPDNGIIFCEDCHYEIGHETGTECSTGNLASKICK